MENITIWAVNSMNNFDSSNMENVERLEITMEPTMTLGALADQLLSEKLVTDGDKPVTFDKWMGDNKTPKALPSNVPLSELGIKNNDVIRYTDGNIVA